MWLLDTDTCIYLIKGKPAGVLDRLRTRDIAACGVSAVTVAELEYGVAKSGRPAKNAEALAALLAPFHVLPFDARAAATYGRVRAGLERLGLPIGSLDLLIAAHALSLDRILVTNNEREFRRIEALRVENWA